MKHKLFLFVFLLTALSVINGQASERKKYNFNSEWKLRIGDFPKAKDAKFDDSKWKQVTLPHAFNEDEAFKLSIEQLTDTVVWYRKNFRIPELKSNQKVFVEFEGVRQRGDFYLNGHYLGRHENGVMAVGFDLTPHIKEGENVIAPTTTGCTEKKELTLSSSGTTAISMPTMAVFLKTSSCTLLIMYIRLFPYIAT